MKIEKAESAVVSIHLTEEKEAKIGTESEIVIETVTEKRIVAESGTNTCSISRLISSSSRPRKDRERDRDRRDRDDYYSKRRH